MLLVYGNSSSCSDESLNIKFNQADITSSVSISILYDNYTTDPETEQDWGFSCFIETEKNTILFDTGKYGEILFHNAQTMDINLCKSGSIIISHTHNDHIGGLETVLEHCKSPVVFLPFSKKYSHSYSYDNIEVIDVDVPVKICDGIYSTGTMGTTISEQSLIINSSKGLILITGCAHPGIINIINRAKSLFNKKIYLVMGGFHLLNETEEKVLSIIKQCKHLGVEKTAPSHCTGTNMIMLFKKEYGDDYIKIGTGTKLIIE